MNRDSLLEVDFEHLAWTPVDPSIASKLPGAIKPLEMARGRNDVYVKAEWVDGTKSQIDEIIAYKKIFDEIDGEDNVNDGLSAKFLPFVTKEFEKRLSEETPKKSGFVPDVETEKPIVKDQSIDDMIGDMDLDSLEDDTDIDSVEIDNHPELQEPDDIQEYSPETKYNYYVINEVDKSVDSGWEGIDSADARLASIEGNGGEGYSVEKYGTSLLKLIGDPIKMDWTPFNTFNFYVENITNTKVDSGHNDNESAKKRVSEIKELLKENDELDIEFGTLSKEKALEKYGLGISFEATWEPVEDLVSKVQKIREDALLESVLTELDNSAVAESLGKFYVIFEYTKDYNPTDDSDRVGGAEEYIEREVFLKKLVSEDGTEEITSKELKKASDKMKLVRPYQRLVKLLNHNASYFYDNLGFAKAKAPYGKLKDHLKTGYNTADDVLDKNPSAQIANKYIEVMTSLKSGNGTFEETLGQLSNTFSKILGEFIGDVPTDEMKISEEEFDAESESNPLLGNLLTVIKSHYEGARLKHIIREVRNHVIPAIMAIPDETERTSVYDELLASLNRHIENEVSEENAAIKQGVPLAKNKESITPFSINQNDPGRSAKNARAGKTLPRKGDYGVAGAPLLYDQGVKEFQRKVNDIVSSISSTPEFRKLASNYKAKSELIDKRYFETYGTNRKDDYKALSQLLKDRSKGGISDYN